MPREPLVLGTPWSPIASEDVADEQRDLDDSVERRPVCGVEIEHDPVRPFGPIDARSPCVQIDAAHRHRPEQRELVVEQRVLDHTSLARSRRGGEGRTLDPVRHVRRGLLLEEVLALPPVRVALHREGPPTEVRDQHGRHVAVVREQVALRDPLLRPERLVEVREPQHPATACAAPMARADA